MAGTWCICHIGRQRPWQPAGAEGGNRARGCTGARHGHVGQGSGSLIAPSPANVEAVHECQLGREVPGLGVRILVQQGLGRVLRQLSPWRAALRQGAGVMPTHCPCKHVSTPQVRLELVVGNFSVLLPPALFFFPGAVFRSPSSLPHHIQPKSAGVALGQISGALSFQSPVFSGYTSYNERSQATCKHPSKGPTREWHNLTSTTP
jgi:hypothetical protein